jgi:hypothetical protein
MQLIENQIIKWNLKFPLDRNYRKKNNITFGSVQHREINQIDLYYDYFEEALYKEIYEQVEEDIESEKNYKQGKMFREEKDVEGQKADDLFDKIKISDLSSIKIED